MDVMGREGGVSPRLESKWIWEISNFFLFFLFSSFLSFSFLSSFFTSIRRDSNRRTSLPFLTSLFLNSSSIPHIYRLCPQLSGQNRVTRIESVIGKRLFCLERRCFRFGSRSTSLLLTRRSWVIRWVSGEAYRWWLINEAVLDRSATRKPRGLTCRKEIFLWRWELGRKFIREGGIAK